MLLFTNIYCQIANFYERLGASDGKESTCCTQDAGDVSLIPGSGRSLGGGYGNPLQYSCLENLMNRGAWWATGHRVSKSPIQLKQLSMSMHGKSH